MCIYQIFRQRVKHLRNLIFLQTVIFISLTLYYVIGIVFGAELQTEDFPFQCPNKVPPGNIPPSATGEQGSGLIATLYENGNLDANSSEVYSEYRAALALTPCDAHPISVFTNPLVAGDYAISVIFVFDKPVQDLKKWLR